MGLDTPSRRPDNRVLTNGRKRRDGLEVMQEVSQEVLESSHYCQGNSCDDDDGDDDDDDDDYHFLRLQVLLMADGRQVSILIPEDCFNVCIVMGLYHRWSRKCCWLTIAVA